MSTESGSLLPCPHEPSNEILKKSFYRGETLKLIFRADTLKTYSRLYHWLSYGLGLYSGTFYNKNIGDPIALFVFIRTPLVRKPRWNIFSETGAGVAVNFNPYHESLNPNNFLIGSRINMVGHLTVGMEYKVTKPISISVNLGYRHFSNGSIKAPNYGINIIPVSLSGSYNFSRIKHVNFQGDIPAFKPHNRVSFFIAPGSKNYSHHANNYFVNTVGVQYIRQIGYKIGIGGGVDLFYKDSGKDKVHSNESDLAKSLSSGINGSGEWVFNENFRINLGVGIYVFRHIENDEPYYFYERIAAKYSISKNIFAGVGVKINKNASDYIEWTVGYMWGNDKNIYKIK